jgi:AcrR family transcriptional regulator
LLAEQGVRPRAPWDKEDFLAGPVDVPSGNKHQIKTENTKLRILAAAEPMFADEGIKGVSMRRIAAAAGVDLSLVIYHFGTKEKMYRALLERLLTEFNALRTLRLDALLRERPDADVIALFDLMISSWLDLHFWKSVRRARLLLRGFANKDQSLDIQGNLSDPLILRFIGEVERVAPGFSREEIHWAYHAVTGSLIFFLNGSERIQRLSDGICEADSYSTIRLVLLRMVRDLFSEREHVPIKEDPLYEDVQDLIEQNARIFKYAIG